MQSVGERRRRCERGRLALRPQQASTRCSSSATTISTHEIGITDCTTLIETAGTLTSVVAREDRQDRGADPAEQHEEGDDQHLRDDVERAPRAPAASASTTSGQPMCARFTDASAEP